MSHGESKKLVISQEMAKAVYRHFRLTETYASAILIECGYHFDRASAETAYDACRRFLSALHMIDKAPATPLSEPKFITITHSFVPDSAAEFSFEKPYQGLQVIEKTGTLIAHDGTTEIRTPYDHCVLLMPTLLPSDQATALRLGRATSLAGQ